MAKSRVTFKDVRKVKKPKAPKMNASTRTWDRFLERLNEWEEYQDELKKRRKFK